MRVHASTSHSSAKAELTAELAARAIDGLIDSNASPDERDRRRSRLTRGSPEFREARVDQPKNNERTKKGPALLNFIELHHDNTGVKVIVNINKIISYERVTGRSYTDLLVGRESVTVRETPAEISQLIVAAQGETS